MLARQTFVRSLPRWREYVEVGGLMNYGTNIADMFKGGIGQGAQAERSTLAGQSSYHRVNEPLRGTAWF
jgi:hypothetical protein